MAREDAWTVDAIGDSESLTFPEDAVSKTVDPTSTLKRRRPPLPCEPSVVDLLGTTFLPLDGPPRVRRMFQNWQRPWTSGVWAEYLRNGEDQTLSKFLEFLPESGFDAQLSR